MGKAGSRCSPQCPHLANFFVPRGPFLPGQGQRSEPGGGARSTIWTRRRGKAGSRYSPQCSQLANFFVTRHFCQGRVNGLDPEKEALYSFDYFVFLPTSFCIRAPFDWIPASPRTRLILTMTSTWGQGQPAADVPLNVRYFVPRGPVLPGQGPRSGPGWGEVGGGKTADVPLSVPIDVSS